MKKLVVTMLTIVTCGAVQALPIRNPGEASLFTNGLSCEGNECCNIWDPCFNWCNAWSLRFGFDGNYVFDRHLARDFGGSEGKKIEATRIFTNAGYIAFNLCDRLDIFGTLGATTIGMDLDSRLIEPILPISLDTLTFAPAFSWSAGGRATLLECGCFTLGLEGEYFRARPNLNYLRSFENRLTHYTDVRTTYSEWQVGLGIAYTIATSCPNLAFVPYLAVAWSGAKLEGTEVEGVANVPQLRNDKLWSYAVGTSFTLCDVIGVNVEGRFGAESACAVNGQFRF